ncbi:hypothetical protein HQ865_22135 [Mucilaginibacter mali]|uniref:Uncharacterized protein n=1 Tax=Mucilaginibacter mali TaxID=2740462 RepID=A0A7D4QEZ3_9SPHI|nr:hypothetical protein [Mucilaginibacter mali]QKJ32344.1 hypothetical protein HQ865_22135 [Mucilaginibacter mali]
MEQNQAHQDLASIRNLMERSSKFLSLSGLSGVLAGVYALIGAALAYYLIYTGERHDTYHIEYRSVNYLLDSNVGDLLFIAIAVLGASLLTGFLLSVRKARRSGQKFWNAGSKALLFNLVVPVLTGGLLILIFIWRGYFGIIAPAALIFYGLALISAGNFTYKGVQYLGINEILLGLLAALFPGYGLLFWATGFGVLHIIYGAVMHFKYEK